MTIFLKSNTDLIKRILNIVEEDHERTRIMWERMGEMQEKIFFNTKMIDFMNDFIKHNFKHEYDSMLESKKYWEIKTFTKYYEEKRYY